MIYIMIDLIEIKWMICLKEMFGVGKIIIILHMVVVEDLLEIMIVEGLLVGGD